jgi:hypothetical protein
MWKSEVSDHDSRKMRERAAHAGAMFGRAGIELLRARMLPIE